jgi:hypothetical protein
MKGLKIIIILLLLGVSGLFVYLASKSGKQTGLNATSGNYALLSGDDQNLNPCVQASTDCLAKQYIKGQLANGQLTVSGTQLKLTQSPLQNIEQIGDNVFVTINLKSATEAQAGYELKNLSDLGSSSLCLEGFYVYLSKTNRSDLAYFHQISPSTGYLNLYQCSDTDTERSVITNNLEVELLQP